ncbi:hypothetical protein AC578_7184 [Pseudocercospora eumusae]|uniref:Uncharacterized protein n=1 Tax=Pseudocercospora eumusae TaxID=321146 RepID=A0A139HWJ8_9PEZI|nr:hypothetical protein AC578_7184 [Pseudocercospora eumusae]
MTTQLKPLSSPAPRKIRQSPFFKLSAELRNKIFSKIDMCTPNFHRPGLLDVSRKIRSKATTTRTASHYNPTLHVRWIKAMKKMSLETPGNKRPGSKSKASLPNWKNSLKHIYDGDIRSLSYWLRHMNKIDTSQAVSILER